MGLRESSKYHYTVCLWGSAHRGITTIRLHNREYQTLRTTAFSTKLRHQYETNVILMSVCDNSILNIGIHVTWTISSLAARSQTVGDNWASVSEPIITWTVLMKFLYVCMYGGHSVLRSNSKLHDDFGKMETHAGPRMPCIISVPRSREIETGLGTRERIFKNGYI